MLKMLLLTFKEFLEEMFQVYRRHFYTWDAVFLLSATVLYATLINYSLKAVGSMFLLSSMYLSFLDEVHDVINGSDFVFVEMAKKMCIWKTIFDVWNVTCTICIGGFSGKILGNFLHSFLTDVYCTMLTSNGWGEE